MPGPRSPQIAAHSRRVPPSEMVTTRPISMQPCRDTAQQARVSGMLAGVQQVVTRHSHRARAQAQPGHEPTPMPPVHIQVPQHTQVHHQQQQQQRLPGCYTSKQLQLGL